MRINRIAFVGTLAATLAGCYSIHTYRGNGELTDNSPDWTMGGRYVLNLGAIRLDEPKVYSYDMAELPPRYRFTVGFDIAHSVDMVREVETHAHIEMLNEMGERVLSVDAPLNEWAHSHALGVPEVYAYRRGTSYDWPILGSNSAMKDSVPFALRLERSDWLAFNKTVNQRLTILAKANSKLLVANLISWIPLGFAMAAYSAMYREHPELLHDLNVVALAIALGVVSVTASFLLRSRSYRRESLSKHGKVLAEHAFEATDQSLIVSGPFGKTTFTWDCFLDREERDGVIHLFIDNAQALVIPTRALRSEEDLTQFRDWSGVEKP